MKLKHSILTMLCIATFQVTGLALQFETGLFDDIPREEAVEKTLAAVNALKIASFTEVDIDFAEAMKYYNQSGLTEADPETALAVIKNSGYSWAIPLTGENDHIIVTFLMDPFVETPTPLAQAAAKGDLWRVGHTAVDRGNMEWKSALRQELATLPEKTAVYLTEGAISVAGSFAYVVTEEAVSVGLYSVPSHLEKTSYTMTDTLFSFSDLKRIYDGLEAERPVMKGDLTDQTYAMPTIIDVLDYAQHKNQSAAPLVWGGLFFVAVVLFGIKLWKTKA